MTCCCVDIIVSCIQSTYADIKCFAPKERETDRQTDRGCHKLFSFYSSVVFMVKNEREKFISAGINN